MNIVYLIGNGFDLNLGMRTKYEHFYDYLNKRIQEHSSPIKRLLGEINKDTEKWSDFELNLGKYLKKIELKEALELYDELIAFLSEYISKEAKKHNLNAEQSHVFGSYLRNPHRGRLLPAEEKRLNNYIENCRIATRSNAWDVKIITFNYTNSIEKLLGFPNYIDEKWKKSHAQSISSIEIEHIHGFIESRLILGVNDTSQISNDIFHKDTKIADRYIKSECNKVYGLEHDEKCQKWLESADLICLFGLSIGDTDKKWWEILGEKIKEKCKLIMFEYNPTKKFNGNQGPARKDAVEAVKDKFLSKTSLDEGLKGKARNNIYVGYNVEMFTSLRSDADTRQLQETRSEMLEVTTT